jgi:hypothetical protein
VQAALFITVYREMPALQQPFRLLSLLMDIDQTLTFWRYRHALMVERMIGRKIGTGGSSGHAYLRSTAERHRIFGDLFQLSTFLIPRSSLPELPADVKRRLDLSTPANEIRFVVARPEREKGFAIDACPGSSRRLFRFRALNRDALTLQRTVITTGRT